MCAEDTRVEGGCLCGAVRYRSRKPPVRGFYCHCNACRKSYGGLYQATVQFLGSDFEFTQGAPKYYASSAFAHRGFCAECGSPLVFAYEGNPDVWVLIGSLDHPEDWPLAREAPFGDVSHWHVDRKLPWLELDDGLPQNSSRTAPFREEAMKFAATRAPSSRSGRLRLRDDP